jgi:Putative prokaryotic signal transducing protein
MRNGDTARSEEPLELVKICGPMEAEMIQEVLSNNGIDSTLQGEQSAKELPGTSDLNEVRIWVRRSDADRARELVEAFFQPVGKDELQEGEPGLGVDDPDEPGGFTV